MLYLYLLLCEIAAAAVIAVSTVLLTARARRNPGRAFKILSGTYAVLFAVRFVWRRDVYFDIIRLQGSPLPPALTVFALLAFWLGLAAGVLMMILPYRQTRLSAFLGVVFAAPAVLVNVAFFPQIALLLGGEDAKFFDARILVFALETAALLATCAVFFIRNIRKIGELKPRGGKRIAFCFAAVFFMLFFSMNSYFLRVLFGSGPNHIYLDFNLYHRLLLYGTFIFPLAGYFLLRGASENARVTALLYIALATMITYSNNIVYLERLKDPWNWPLHLCNTAMYIIPICLITRWEKLFYFTYFINVFGAGMAMLMPNYKDYFLFSPGVVNFWINHSMAFGMPLLIVALRVFPRPKLRQFGYSAAGFLFYFIIALVCNAWFSNYTETPVDFFFINDDFVLSKLGKSFSVKVLNIKAAFKVGNATLTFYPLYQPVFFVCYLAVGLAMWFVYDNTFIFADNYHRMTLLRLARKQDEAAFFKQMEGRGRREPFLPGGTEMIEIKNVYKRYAKSKYYAVAGVSLTVKTGEVFGFLGPNGAGKSTIIKSLVGIQQLTSGNIFVCGYDTERQSVDAKMNIGFVPDHYAL
ncbi:MAG: YwaF family protein, partial [Firmicutes bacterium]|nr:YwaF family protein [Bacillota bacterium]